MSIPSKWRIFALTLPLTILFGLAKLLFHQQGWELWTFNALTSSLFGAATFIIAFQLNGTLSDYRSSDNLLTQFCVSIESIQDSNLLTAKTYPDYDPQPSQLRGTPTHYQELRLAVMGDSRAVTSSTPDQSDKRSSW